MPTLLARCRMADLVIPWMLSRTFWVTPSMISLVSYSPALAESWPGTATRSIDTDGPSGRTGSARCPPPPPGRNIIFGSDFQFAFRLVFESGWQRGFWFPFNPVVQLDGSEATKINWMDRSSINPWST